MDTITRLGKLARAGGAIATFVFSVASIATAGTPSPQDRLVLAAWRGDVAELERQQQKGGDLQARAAGGLTAWRAAELGGRPEMLAWLKDHGVAPDAQPAAPEAILDGWLSIATSPDRPGVAVLVAQHGKIVFEKGYGIASEQPLTPITVDTQFRIGSVTKQFTSAAILKLQEEGKLSVSDPLSKYFPDFPNGSAITLHHLLSHTSGIHSYTAQPDFISRVVKPITTEALINEIKTYPADFAPGAKWSYSNSGYVILGAIVEKVSGMPYEQFLKRALFEPLGMKATGAHHAGEKLANEAIGFQKAADRGFERAPNWDMSWAGGAGILYSTVGDLYRWNEAIFGGKVLKPETQKAAFTPAKTEADPQPKSSGYGYGWNISEYRGAAEIGHGGGLQGFLSSLLRVPEHELTVVILQNTSPTDGLPPADILAHHVVDLYLGVQLKAHPVAKPGLVLSTDALNALAGRYDYGMAVLVVTREDDKLFAKLGGQPRFQIFPKSETEFFWKVVDAQVKFEKDAQGKVVRAVHHQNGQTITAARLPELQVAKVENKSADALLGEYDYGVHGKLTISREGEHLFAQLTGQPRLELAAVSENEYSFASVNAKLVFTRDAAGKVTKLTHHQGGQTIEAPKVK
jgi:CubicO group peptidase (beta-lactamase class C family)